MLISSPIGSRGSNPKISAQINQGFYVKDGEIQYHIKNAVIGCTVFELYKKIEDMSIEDENRSGNEAPWMLLCTIQISGGK